MARAIPLSRNQALESLTSQQSYQRLASAADAQRSGAAVRRAQRAYTTPLLCSIGFDNLGLGAGLRDWKAIFLEAFNVEVDRFTDQA